VLSSKKKWKKGPFDKYFALSKIRFFKKIGLSSPKNLSEKSAGDFQRTSKKIIYP
jgi:hypothetical protein